MTDPDDTGVAATLPASKENGSGAPAWLDDFTNARFTHYDRLPLHALVGLDPDLTTVLDAHFIDCTPQRLREIRQEHTQTLSATAASLLAEESFAADLAHMASFTGPRMVVLGDSITADSLGWAELLRVCLDAAGSLPGAERVTLVNLAVSGFTTTETIPLFSLVLRESPTCVLAMLGTNDGRRQGASADVRTVSNAETERNLQALRTLATAECNAGYVAIAPPPMNQDVYEASVEANAPVRFSSEDLAETLAVVRLVFPDVIDVPALVGDDVAPDFWLPDGLHPSQRGQVVLVRHIVRALARMHPTS